MQKYPLIIHLPFLEFCRHTDMNTTSSNGLLVPRPPNLLHVAERQAFSGSSASFSSTSSSSASAGFGRYSRNSSGSAYLTDLTPPISPSQSRCDIKSAGDDYEAGKSISSSLAENLVQSGQEQSDHIDDKVALCSNMRAPRDQGYSADSESEEITCDTFAASPTKLGRASQSINTRRALQIMERRAKPKSGPVEENVPRMPSLSSKVVITELGVHGVQDWSEAFGATCVVQQTSSPPSDHASEASIVKDSQGSLEDSSDYAAQSSQGSNPHQDDSFFRSPRIPPKPVIRPTELNQECSPLSLYSQDFSSCMSVSLLLLSPPDLDASNALSSPAIYNESFAHANSPLSSPVQAISSRMFSSRISHRTPSDALTGEDLDIAALMHLETAAGLGMGMHSTPNRRTSALSAQVPLPLDCPYYEESWEAKDDPSFSRRQAEAILSNADDYGLPSNHELSGPLVDIQRRIEQANQPVIGLGLGQRAESSLCSSSSISRLYSATNATLEVNEECADDRRSSPAAKSIVADPKIEPLGAIFHQSSYAATATEDLSLSPISNLPQKRLPRPPRRNERRPEVNAAPVIEPSALKANSHVLASNPKSIQSHGSAKHKSQDPSHMTDEEVDVVAFLDQDPVGVLDKYADIGDLQLRHLPLQHPRSAHDKLAESHVIEQRSALREKGSYKPPPPGSASLSHELGDNGAQKNGVPVRLSGLPALATDSKSTQKPKLEVKLGTCGYTHRSFPLPSFQPYRDPPAYNTVSLRPNPTFLRDCRRDDSPPGSPPFLLTPENDPRSPCSPSSHISRRQSAISGSSFSSQGLSAGSSNGTSASPSAEQAVSAILSSNSSFPGDSAELSVAAGLKESKSADSVGIGLPSDLASRPPRQRELSTSSIVGLTDSMKYGLLPTTASCQNLAQLATGPSPDLNTPAAEGGADEFINLEDSRPLSKFTRFAQRCLSAIPEQTTPSPTTLSPCRLRIATPFSPPSSPTWADFSVFTRLRSPRSPSRLSSFARIPSPLAESSEAPTNDNFCPSIEEDVKTSSVNAKNLFRKYFRGGKESTRGPESAPMMDAPQTPPSSTSPGIVEHPSAPKGLKIFKRHRQAQLPGSAGRRPRSPIRRFQVLF
ncbi:hypothetical protein CPB84DRAFT_1787883 [Gymnopilus junonius]|uniref:Uncharacterized protein n=1 Tax=Gymnopilus junonius TaxID=109634 RepID=A0A9P5NER1_GYMJU|nr:hypothetical protein CPB84DRAFT_1787883 [Gymnopilus junonius]